MSTVSSSDASMTHRDGEEPKSAMEEFLASTMATTTTTSERNRFLSSSHTTTISREESARTVTRSNVVVELGGGEAAEVVVDNDAKAPIFSVDDARAVHDSSATATSSFPSSEPAPRVRSARDEPNTLVWSHVTVTVNRRSNRRLCFRGGNGDTVDPPSTGVAKDEVVKILDDVSGVLPPRRVTAVMGPSGAGKTTLLNVLAGRMSRGGRGDGGTELRRGVVSLDCRPTHRLRVRRRIAFVAQDDSLPPTATPREAIRFSARLRGPRDADPREIDARVARCLSELGLEERADAVLGASISAGDGARRVSGGERRRTAVGVELVVRPSVLFLDEPTSGLDSYSASRLVATLRSVSRRDATSVLCTVHQPSSEVFADFDHLVLLHKGRIMYDGAVDDVGAYFGRRGRAVPPRHNPADWILHVAQSTPLPALEKAGFFETTFTTTTTMERNGLDNDTDEGQSLHSRNSLTSLSTIDLESNLTMTRRSTTPKAVRKQENNSGHQRVTMWTEFTELLQREYVTLYRDPNILGARFALNILMATLIGIIFWKVGGMDDGDVTVFQSHFGAVFMVLLNSMFGSALPTLLSFPQERPVFLREYATEHYSVVAYFLSRLIVESTITLAQVVVQITIAYHTIELQSDYALIVAVAYALAMTSTAVAATLGCAVRDPKLAQEMLPVVFVPQMLFAGFFVSTSLVPEWLRWVQYLCPLMYTTRLVLLAEFRRCEPGLAQWNCERLLTHNNALFTDRWWYWTALLGLFLVYRLVALVILKRKANRF